MIKRAEEIIQLHLICQKIKLCELCASVARNFSDYIPIPNREPIATIGIVQPGLYLACVSSLRTATISAFFRYTLGNRLPQRAMTS